MSKPKVATTSLCGCFGCHMSLLDIDERILQLIELVDFDKSPIDEDKVLEYASKALLAENLEVHRRVLGEEHPDTPIAMNNLASLYSTSGRYPEAEELHALVKQGLPQYGMEAVGEGKDSEGSEWISFMARSVELISCSYFTQAMAAAWGGTQLIFTGCSLIHPSRKL